MVSVERFHWDSADYTEAFSTLLRCGEGRVQECQVLRQLFSQHSAKLHGVDWGAGNGDLTGLMMEHFHHVYAVEPQAGRRAILARRYPTVEIVDGTIMSTVLPTKVEVGLISHVFYHVPDREWVANTLHAAQQLTENGTLVVTLKASDSGCNQMLANFGAPRYDLQGVLTQGLQGHPGFTLSFVQTPGAIATTSFADTLTIARFMLCDREADEFSKPPTEASFRTYVREHFWDEEKGRGGWQYDTLFCCVQHIGR